MSSVTLWRRSGAEGSGEFWISAQPGAGEEEDRINYQFPLAEPSLEAGHVFIKRIGRQMTEPGRDPTFPPIAPIAALVAPAAEVVVVVEAEDAPVVLRGLTIAPLDPCGTTVMAGIVWLGVKLQ